MKTPEQKISQLEETIKKQSQMILSLSRKIDFLERENNRRKSEISQIGQRKNV